MRINKLTWCRALSLAVMAGRDSGRKQRVYKHPYEGWTWGDAA